jgi:hypothetical protein
MLKIKQSKQLLRKFTKIPVVSKILDILFRGIKKLPDPDPEPHPDP